MSNPTQTTTAQKQWLTTQELFEEYGFTVSAQNKMRMSKRIPYSKIGGYVRYSRTAIDSWLEDAAVVKV